MKLSVKGEYACLAMLELARGYGKGLVKIEHIAKHEGIPKKYLEQILLALKNAGYLTSRRGASGGYELAKPPARISVAAIVRLMDGALAPVESASRYFYSHTPSERSKPLSKLFREIRDMVSKKLEQTTFADLAREK